MNYKIDCQHENETSDDKDIIIEDNYYYYEALEYLEQDNAFNFYI